MIAPRGDTIVEPNDRVILFAVRHAIGEVEKFYLYALISSNIPVVSAFRKESCPVLPM